MVRLGAFGREILREIGNTAERFIGVFAIVALGVFVFAGLGSTGTIMKDLGDLYFSNQRFMDIRVVSALGLSEGDIEAMRAVEGVGEVCGAYTMDAKANYRDASAIVKVHGLRMGNDKYRQVNMPRLISGRYPESRSEAVVEPALLDMLGAKIGDTVILTSGKREDIRVSLKTDAYKLVGTVEHPAYFSEERGTSSIGSGRVDCYMVIPEGNFLQSSYSEALISLEGADGLYSYSGRYLELVGGAVERLEDLGGVRVPERKRELTAGAWRKIKKAQTRLEKSRELLYGRLGGASAELASGQARLDIGRAELAARGMELSAAFLELEQSEQRINEGLAEIEAGLQGIAGARNTLAASGAELEESGALLSRNGQELESQKTHLALAVGMPELADVSRAWELTPEQEAMLSGAGMLEPFLSVLEGQARLAAARDELESGVRSYNQGLREAADTAVLLEAQKASLYGSLGEISSARLELQRARSTLLDKEAELQRSQAGLRSSRTLYERNREAALKETQAAMLEIEAQKELLYKLDEPKWYVLDRSKNTGYESYSQDADKIHAIGKTIPLIFFLVAAFISLTTMSRLVEERRTEMGTLKSLGYTNGMILSKYMIYAFVPTFFGSLLGGLAGMYVLPWVVINAYSSMYAFVPYSPQINFAYWMGGLILAVLSTLLTTAYACLAELRRPPSVLMRAKPPRAGGKTFLEKVTPVWSRLTFIQKVTVRNIIRFRKRFAMTVIGVGGCTALLLMGFGVRDSVSGIVENQYGKILMYDLIIGFSDSADEADVRNVSRTVQSDPAVSGHMMMREKMMTASNASGDDEDVTLIVPGDISRAGDFFNLRERAGHKPLTMSDDGVIINEKLSILLGLGEGDSIMLSDSNGERGTALISGVCETYIMHSVYMTPDYYREIFRSPAENNSVYVIFKPGSDSAAIRDFSDGVLDGRGVGYVTLVSDLKGSADRVMGNLDVVIVVIIFLAGALAFVVLLNLTNININERTRELATLEVLGFRDNEVASYVYRENIVVSLVGAVFGLLLGRYLHMYIILSVEIDIMMFSRSIHTVSYFLAAIITMAFTVGVNFMTGGRLRKINMVEALKSVE